MPGQADGARAGQGPAAPAGPLAARAGDRLPGPSLEAEGPAQQPRIARPLVTASPVAAKAEARAGEPLEAPPARERDAPDESHEDAPPGAGQRGRAATAQSPAAAEVPVYPARLPAPFARQYRLTRAGQSGSAVWDFRRETGADYVSSLIARFQRGAPWLELTSIGGVAAEQLRPQRSSDRRRGRGLQAASFDAEAGLIRFSGQAPAQPLLPGSQDRLSAMLQLSAILNAQPFRAGSGQRILLHVAGARGDASVWVFESKGLVPDGTELPNRAGLVYLVREPTQPYDTRVELWLDPARDHLPRSWRWTPTAGGAPLDAELE